MSVTAFYFLFLIYILFTMVSKQYRNRLFAVKFIFEKKVFVMFPCSGCKTINPDHFEKSCIVALNNNVCSRCVRFGRVCNFFFRTCL